jgi:hypothetical protein
VALVTTSTRVSTSTQVGTAATGIPLDATTVLSAATVLDATGVVSSVVAVSASTGLATAGGGTADVAITGALPVIQTSPVVTPSSVSTGGTLTTTNGTWSNAPNNWTYQWRRAGVNISGATSSTYVVVAADVGQAVTCAVTAVNATGSSIPAVSNAVTPVAAGAPPVIQTSPVVSPTSGVVVGATVSCTSGTWLNTPNSFAYQWRRAGTSIAGAQSATYVTVSADAGQALTCAVTATNGAGSTVATSSNSVVPAAADVTPPAAPTGLVAVGQVGSIALNWSDNTEPDLNVSAPYIVERATAVGGPFTQTTTTVSSDYVDFFILPGVTYYYRVRAQDNTP